MSEVMTYGMLKRRLILSVIISILTSLVTILSDINLSKGQQPSSVANFVFYFIIFAFCSYAGLFFSSRNGFITLVTSALLSFRKKILHFLLYGVVAGIVIGIINTMVLKLSLDSSNLPEWLNSFNSIKDTFILSARASFMEETIFRLFLFSGITWLSLLTLQKLLKKEKQQLYITSVIIGIVISSILFGLMHGSGFFYSAFMGVLLCIIYYKGGFESAIIAHFLGNFISFSIVFLN
jgi:membrane protease YdiL (CAAX protease family)